MDSASGRRLTTIGPLRCKRLLSQSQLHRIETILEIQGIMNMTAILHALIATLYQNQYAVARRLLDDPTDISLYSDIPNGAPLIQWLSHSDDDEVFEILDALGFLEREVGKGSYDYHDHALKLSYPTLREQLANEPLSEFLSEQVLVGCFIQHAASMDRFNIIGDVRLAGLPTHKDWFAVPSYYIEAVREIAAMGYCRISADKANWLPAVSTIMETRGYWIGDRTADEVHQETLKSIWETMPAMLKQGICDEQGKVNALTLAWAMGEFWSSEDGWNVHPLPAGDEFHLQGGHLPDAIQIVKMVEEGRLPGPEK